MHIKDKMMMEKDQLIKNGPITIVAFGDSITHGAVGPGEIDYESVYWNRLKKKLNAVRSYVPVNVINAGIGGITAARSLERMDSQVLAHSPDLVIVCFGLNDVNGTLESYLGALRTIFQKCQDRGCDVIFLTPNMLNTYVAEDTAPVHLRYAAVTAEFQNNGKMDQFMAGACALAKEMNVPVCDCYAEWKKRSETEDTTLLLANRINHPTREMHELFADRLFHAIIDEQSDMTGQDSNTMYTADDKTVYNKK